MKSYAIIKKNKTGVEPCNIEGFLWGSVEWEKQDIEKNVKYVSILVIQKATLSYVGLSVCVCVCVCAWLSGTLETSDDTDYWGPNGDEGRWRRRVRALQKGKRN